MTISDDYPENERPIEAWCDLHYVHVKLHDGRELATPLWWYPRLLKATESQRNTVRLMLDGIHWPEVDEDLSINGMLKGWKAPNAIPPAIAAE
jgi:Protein of unknown function (DUF2442)